VTAKKKKPLWSCGILVPVSRFPRTSSICQIILAPGYSDINFLSQDTLRNINRESLSNYCKAGMTRCWCWKCPAGPQHCPSGPPGPEITNAQCSGTFQRTSASHPMGIALRCSDLRGALSWGVRGRAVPRN